MRHALAIGLASTLVIVAACGGGNSSPTSPSSSGGPAAGSPTGATVRGTINNVTSTTRAEGVSGALDTAGFTVTVVGTGITASVSSNGQFTLTGVPAGDIQIHITGPGVDATLTLSNVQAGQTIEIKIKVSGNTATLDDDARQVSGQMEIEGRVEAPLTAGVAPTVFTTVVAGKVINILATTAVRKGNTSYPVDTALPTVLLTGFRVHVKGTANTTNPTAPSVDALEVKIQNENADLPSQYEYEGVIASVTGSAAAFTVTLTDGRVIRGDSNTRFADGSFASLLAGVEIEAKGVIVNDATGSYLRAGTIEFEDGDDEDNDGEDDGEFEGTVSGASVGGSCPSLSFSLTVKNGPTYGVTTTPSTTFEPACAAMALKVGDKVEVEGTLTAGSIAATKVEKNMKK